MTALHDGVSGLRRGALARATGCNIETIRYYEGVGLLPAPPRTAAGHRVYGAEHLRRLRFVMRARALGFTLDEIRGLIALAEGGGTCDEVRAQAEAHLADVRARIADLARVEAVLADTAARCAGGEAPDCPVLAALAG